MLKSITGLIIQILLVVAGVILFSYFDPFGLLSPKKKTLQDTPITVVSIKEIGQLITAEYYGEVLSSLQDTLISEIKAGDEDLVKEINSLNTTYINALKDFYSRKDSIEVRWLRRRKDLLEYFYDSNPGITNNPFYQDMIALVLKKNNYDNEGDLLLDIWKKKEVDFEKETKEGKYKIDTAVFMAEKLKALEELTKHKAFKKRQIIALGRGWVRAGIDFGKFTEQNFKYDKAKKIVYLFGLEPQILDCDINPWFIPEKKVKGFEIIAATNKANDAASLVKVKESCLNKLRAQAEVNGIIKHARVNAEESLKHFFSLLLGESIERVFIMENSIAAYKKSLYKDGILPKERLLLVDSVLLSMARIDSASALEMVADLAKAKYEVDLEVYSINRFSSLTYRLSEDKIITSAEWKQLSEEMKDSPYSKLDSLWFFPFESYTEISDSSRSITFKKLKYSQGLKFWLDSVLLKQEYVAFEKEFNGRRQIIIESVMRQQQKLALSQSILFLKKSTRTITLDERKALNSSVEIEACLDSLQASLKK